MNFHNKIKPRNSNSIIIESKNDNSSSYNNSTRLFYDESLNNLFYKTKEGKSKALLNNTINDDYIDKYIKKNISKYVQSSKDMNKSEIIKLIENEINLFKVKKEDNTNVKLYIDKKIQELPKPDTTIIKTDNVDQNLQINYTGIWSIHRKYNTNDIVIDKSNNNNYYICIKSVNSKKSKPSSNKTNWKLFLQNILSFKNEWNDSVLYYENNIVSYNKCLYMCKKDNMNKQPSKNNTDWDVILSFDWIQDYIDSKYVATQYDIGVVVYVNNNFYMAKRKCNELNIKNKNYWVGIKFNSNTQNIITETIVKQEVDPEYTNLLKSSRSGRDGKNGKDGIDGDPGPPGKQGEKGDKGDKGDTGLIGEKGDTGEKGNIGDTGEKGDKGDTGEKGVKGDKGEKGDKGDIGELGRDGRDGVDGRDGISFHFKSVWSRTRKYTYNDVVIDPSDYDTLYIYRNRKKELVSTKPPHKDTINWTFFFGNNIVFRSRWAYETEYSKNHIVIDNNDYNLYICKSNLKSYTNPSADHENWDIFFSNDWANAENKNDISSSLLFAVFSNNTCCIRYDNDQNHSVYDPSNCQYRHKYITESNLYNFIEYIVKNDTFTIPLNIINTLNNSYYKYNNNLTIRENGYYRITYNITYHGSVYNIKSAVSVFFTTEEYITYSVNRSVNRYGSEDDSYYENIEDEDKLEDITNYINHSFITPLKKGQTIKLLLKFTKRNMNKKLFIHPLNTWITVEKVQ